MLAKASQAREDNSVSCTFLFKIPPKPFDYGSQYIEK